MRIRLPRLTWTPLIVALGNFSMAPAGCPPGAPVIELDDTENIDLGVETCPFSGFAVDPLSLTVKPEDPLLPGHLDARFGVPLYPQFEFGWRQAIGGPGTTTDIFVGPPGQRDAVLQVESQNSDLVVRAWTFQNPPQELVFPGTNEVDLGIRHDGNTVFFLAPDPNPPPIPLPGQAPLVPFHQLPLPLPPDPAFIHLDVTMNQGNPAWFTDLFIVDQGTPAAPLTLLEETRDQAYKTEAALLGAHNFLDPPSNPDWTNAEAAIQRLLAEARVGQASGLKLMDKSAVLFDLLDD